MRHFYSWLCPAHLQRALVAVILVLSTMAAGPGPVCGRPLMTSPEQDNFVTLCHTAEPDSFERADIAREEAGFHHRRGRRGIDQEPFLDLPVVFLVVHAGTEQEGLLSTDRIDRQIVRLNEDYSGVSAPDGVGTDTRIRFHVHDVKLIYSMFREDFVRSACLLVLGHWS